MAGNHSWAKILNSIKTGTVSGAPAFISPRSFTVDTTWPLLQVTTAVPSLPCWTVTVNCEPK